MDTAPTSRSPVKPIPTRIRHHLLKQPLSGKTIKDYCGKAGLSPWTFYNWRKRYGNQITVSADEQSPQPAKPSLTFTTIGTVCLPENRSPLFDIRFPTGVGVSVYSGTTAEQLSPFLSLVSGGSASC